MVQANKIRIVYQVRYEHYDFCPWGIFLNLAGACTYHIVRRFLPDMGTSITFGDVVCSPPTRNGLNYVLFLGRFMDGKFYFNCNSLCNGPYDDSGANLYKSRF